MIIHFYSVSIVYFDEGQILSSGLSQFTIAYADSPISDANVFYDSTSIHMLDFNTLIGVKAFHARTGLTPNYLNFQTVFVNSTFVRFPSTNNVNWKYMKF